MELACDRAVTRGAVEARSAGSRAPTCTRSRHEAKDLRQRSAYCSNAQVHEDLNEAQREAVLAGSLEPLLIIAGAGTGKTTTLAHRIAQLVADGADPRRIMLLTFSRRAAGEMTRRAQRVTRGVDLPWAGT